MSANEEIGALLRRADALSVQVGTAESMHWRGYAKCLRDLQSNGGKKAAAKEDGQEPLASPLPEQR